MMQVAITKYNDRKQSNTWQAASPEEEQVLALTIQISNIQTAKLTAATDDKEKRTDTKRGAESQEKARMALNAWDRRVVRRRRKTLTRRLTTSVLIPKTDQELGRCKKQNPTKV